MRGGIRGKGDKGRGDGRRYTYLKQGTIK